MTEEKYTALFVDQSLDLIKRLFVDEEKAGFFISNRTLHELFDRVQDHLARAFPEGLEQVTLRQLRNKLDKFRHELLKSRREFEHTKNRQGEAIPIIPEEIGREALKNGVKDPSLNSW